MELPDTKAECPREGGLSKLGEGQEFGSDGRSRKVEMLAMWGQDVKDREVCLGHMRRLGEGKDISEERLGLWVLEVVPGCLGICVPGKEDWLRL